MASAIGEARGLGQIGIELLRPGVEAADNALQFGEFLYQFGGEIGLGEQGGLVHHAGANRQPVLLDGFREPTGEALHAQSLFVVAAEVFLEGDVLQQPDAIEQSLLLVGLPEKAGVVEAGAQYALIAVADQAIGIAGGIEHRQKMRQQLAVRIFNREIFLVVAHHRDQHFFGEREKLGIEVAEDDGREFREVHYRGEERGIFAPARAGNCARGSIESFADDLLALGAPRTLAARRAST